MQGIKFVSNIAMVAALALSSQLLAETAPEAGKTKGDAAKGQQIATQVCAACHNADGNSSIPANPSLAGQHAEYITKQLNDFKPKEGKRAERESAIMSAMVAPLSQEDMQNLGVY
jgi:cytochrome c553